MNPSPWWCAFLLIPVVLVCFGRSLTAQTQLGLPGGSNGQVQYKVNSSTFGGITNFTYSDPTNTLLIGSSSVPDISRTWLYGGAQLLISSRFTNPGPRDTKVPFAVVGDYRNGSSGDRYNLFIGQDGWLQLNTYINLFGFTPPSAIHAIDNACMMQVVIDVPIGLSIVGSVTTQTEASGCRLITGWGPPDGLGHYARSFELGTQGTMRLVNTLGASYTYPQVILRDSSAGNPGLVDYGFKSVGGVLTLGSYNNSNNTLNTELQIKSNEVDLNADTVLLGQPRIKGVKIASLPASPAAGQVAYVTDGNSGLAWGARAINSGSGATKYLVWYNGSAWTVVGK
jgi:hypothetical protein